MPVYFDEMVLGKSTQIVYPQDAITAHPSKANMISRIRIRSVLVIDCCLTKFSFYEPSLVSDVFVLIAQFNRFSTEFQYNSTSQQFYSALSNP